MRARLNNAECVTLVGMPRIAMDAGIRSQEVDATESVKPPIV